MTGRGRAGGAEDTGYGLSWWATGLTSGWRPQPQLRTRERAHGRPTEAMNTRDAAQHQLNTQDRDCRVKQRGWSRCGVLCSMMGGRYSRLWASWLTWQYIEGDVSCEIRTWMNGWRVESRVEVLQPTEAGGLMTDWELCVFDEKDEQKSKHNKD